MKMMLLDGRSSAMSNGDPADAQTGDEAFRFMSAILNHIQPVHIDKPCTSFSTARNELAMFIHALTS